MSEPKPVSDIIATAQAVYQATTHMQGMSSDVRLGILNGMRLSILETLVTLVLEGLGNEEEVLALSQWQGFAHDEEHRILEEQLSESSR